MSLENLKTDFANLFAAVKEHNARMITNHAAKKAAGEPVLNPSFWFIDQELLKSYATNKFADFGETEPNIGDTLHAVQKLIQADAATCSTKDFTSVFYATLKESAVPNTMPEDLLMDFYAQLQGAAQDVGYEG